MLNVSQMIVAYSNTGRTIDVYRHFSVNGSLKLEEFRLIMPIKDRAFFFTANIWRLKNCLESKINPRSLT